MIIGYLPDFPRCSALADSDKPGFNSSAIKKKKKRMICGKFLKICKIQFLNVQNKCDDSKGIGCFKDHIRQCIQNNQLELASQYKIK